MTAIRSTGVVLVGLVFVPKERSDELVAALRQIVERKETRYTTIYNRNSEKDGD